MIVVCNGTYKSGSSLLRLITEQICEPAQIIDENLNKRHGDRFTFDNEIEYIIDKYNSGENFYVIKVHCYNHRLLKKITESNKLLLIERDLNDVLLSHYYHVVNKKNFKIPFYLYFLLFGFFKANQVIYYNKVIRIFYANSNVFNTTFERLKQNKESEIIRLANFLKVTLSEEKVKQILIDTSLEKFRSNFKARSWFFRKGKIGESRELIPKIIYKFINFYERKCPIFINRIITSTVFFYKK